jgi:hypothetical protein
MLFTSIGKNFFAIIFTGVIMKIVINKTFEVRCRSYGDFTAIIGHVFSVCANNEVITLRSEDSSCYLVRSEFLEMLRTGNVAIMDESNES